MSRLRDCVAKRVNDMDLFEYSNKCLIAEAAEFEEIIKTKDAELISKNAELVQNWITISHQTEEIQQQTNINECLEMAIDTVKEDVAPKVVSKGKRHCFCLIKKNVPYQTSFPYATIRVQKRNCGRSMRRLVSRYPRCEVLLELPYSPNAVNLNNRIKEQLSGTVKFRYNDLATTLSDAELCESIRNVHALIM